MPVPSTSSPTSRKLKKSSKRSNRPKLTLSSSNSRNPTEREIINLDPQRPASEASDSRSVERTGTPTGNTLPLGLYIGIALSYHDRCQDEFEGCTTDHPIEKFHALRFRERHFQEEPADHVVVVVETGDPGESTRSPERVQVTKPSRTSSSVRVFPMITLTILLISLSMRLLDDVGTRRFIQS